jgi:hypothetical protein
MLGLRARGQTLPIWAMGLGAALVLAFSALQYGEVLRWQIRAQNAADAAAAGALSVQTSAWNQQMAVMYAASVEEWRIRNLLEAMVVASAGDPGCARGNSTNCQPIYKSLKDQYASAVARYTTDVQLMSRVSQYTLPQAQADAKAIVADFQRNCGKANGGDCGVSYTVTDIRKRVGNLNDVEQDGGAWVVNGIAPARVKDDYTPAQIEIVTCAKVPPLVPGFLNFTPPTFTAVGRAAATSAMVTEEWIQPGVIVNPQTGKPFQPPEDFSAGSTTATGPNGHNWFVNDYGGNAAKAYPLSDAYSERINGPEFSAVTGWWSTIPIKPYSGALAQGSYSCATSGS